MTNATLIQRLKAIEAELTNIKNRRDVLIEEKKWFQTEEKARAEKAEARVAELVNTIAEGVRKAIKKLEAREKEKSDNVTPRGRS